MKVCHRWKETGNNCEEFNNVVRSSEELEAKLKAAEQERDRLKEEYDGLDLAWKEERAENFRNVQRADLAEQERQKAELAVKELGPLFVRDIARLVGLLDDAKMDAIANAVQKLADEKHEELAELKSIRKIAKADSIEDLLTHQSESETVLRLRLFGAIASLRVELMANKGHPELVQRVCDQAAKNLQRAEVAEQEQERLKNKLQRALGALADIGWSADMEIDSSLQSKKARRIYNEIMDEK